jgi:hypothetical protein
MQDATIHYGTLEGSHRTRTSLRKSPQLNWRLLRIAIKGTTKPQSRLGFQEPKSNKLLTFTSMNLRGELKPMHQMQ